jgi:hypothetical protein
VVVRSLALASCAALLVAAGGAARAAGSLPAPATPTQTGIVWPAERVFPRFATATHFDVADVDGTTPDEKVMLATLEGLVNRRKPRIYLIGRVGEGRTTWLDTLAVEHTMVADPWQLVQRYRSELKGIVIDDPNVPATVNVATTLAGLDDALVASPDLAGRLQGEEHLPVIEDLRGRFKDDLSAYRWEVDQLWPRTTHRLLVGIGPREYAGFRDYPVAVKALAISLRVGEPDERALWDKLAHDMPPNSPYIGWFDNHERASGEIPGVWFLTQHGQYDVAGDLFGNLTAFSGVQAPELAQPQPAAPAVPLQGKIYITITQSDGDNLQYMQHRMRMVWADPARGQVPMNWTVQPLAADCAPMLLEYYRKTATPNDYLVAGPNGAGYAFVSMFPSDVYQLFARQTGVYFARTGIRVMEMHNMMPGGPQAPPAGHAAALVAGAQPLGVLTFIKGMQPQATVFGGGLMGATQAFVHDVASTRAEIERLSAGWDGRTPRFIAIYLDAWHMGPADAVAIANGLGPNYQVVRGDTFFELARQANGLPAQ